MKEQRTLCARCAKNYIDAGYTLRRDYSVTIKEPCDICGRADGWQWWIEGVWQRNGRYDSMQAKHGATAEKKY